MYKHTKIVFNNIVINSTIGIRQGSSSSGPLFTVFLDRLVRYLKEMIPFDSFLQCLHSLLLMDDTAILATSRDMCLRKLRVVYMFCQQNGMKINMQKSNFIVINNNPDDLMPLVIEDLCIYNCETYCYLGSYFANNGSMKQVVEKHIEKNLKHVNKFSSFCYNNQNMPFYLKKKVAESVIITSLLYGTETWLQFPSSMFKRLNTLYLDIVKILLNVRNSTSNLCCLLEIGFPSLRARIDNIRYKFLVKKLQYSNLDEPFMYVFRLCESISTPGYVFLQNTLNLTNIIKSSLDSMKSQICESNYTKLVTYLSINPDLIPHPVYSSCVFIPDFHRTSFSRFRLSSHNLKIEVLRWQRIPQNLRYCTCDGISIQNENHVLFQCPFTINFRTDFNSFNDFFKCENLGFICKVIHDTLFNFN